MKLPTLKARTKALIIYAFLNASTLFYFYYNSVPSSAKRFQSPDPFPVEAAFNGYVLYASGCVAILIILFSTILDRALAVTARAIRFNLSPVLIVLSCTILMGLGYINDMVYTDYGVHIYEFNILDFLFDVTIRKYIGVTQNELEKAFRIFTYLFLFELVAFTCCRLIAGLLNSLFFKMALIGVGTALFAGLTVYAYYVREIPGNNFEFFNALPLKRLFFLEKRRRPFLPTIPRTGAPGYPLVKDEGGNIPRVLNQKNIVVFLLDGLRADYVLPDFRLMPNLRRFCTTYRPLISTRHCSTSHYTDQGFFGILYALDAYHYYPFLKDRVPSYPLEILKRNGYMTALFTHSYFSKFPTNWMMGAFDQALYAESDDEVIVLLREFLEQRRRDHRPYLICAFLYTPHYPHHFKMKFNKYTPNRQTAYTDEQSRLAWINSYKNCILQGDDYFQKAFEWIRPGFERGDTILLFTSDHGTEFWDHDEIVGQGKASFWNEKILVPFLLGYRGLKRQSLQRTISLSSHVDIFPTLLDIVQLSPELSPSVYSDGISLLSEPAAADRDVFIAGKVFPYTNQINAVVDSSHKFWFRITGLTKEQAFQYRPLLVTDINDLDTSRPLDIEGKIRRLQDRFGRFLQIQP